MDDPNFPKRDLPEREIPDRYPRDAVPAYHRRWKWSVNVILIGTSQSGKSTLINRFRSMAIGPHPLPGPAEVGKGDFSCTRDPFLYEFDIEMTDYVLVEGPGRKPVQFEEDDVERSIFDLGIWKRKDLQLCPRVSYPDIARIRLLDTPGLDDDKPAKNAENIQKVLQILSSYANSDDLDKRTISAVMFVIKSGISFNDSLQTWYHYYRRCMPNLFGSIAVVNTNFRLKDWKTEYAKKALNAVTLGGAKMSTRDCKMKERREAWAGIFHKDPTHFFIDSKPEKSPIGEYTSVNTVYDILLYLRSQGKVPIDNLRLVKLPQMAAIDARLAGLLSDIRVLWESEREHLYTTQTVGQKSLARHKKNRLDWANRIEELEKKLKIWDSDVPFDLNTHSPTHSPTDTISMQTKIWKSCTFRGFENTFEIKEKVWPFQVNAPDSEDTKWVSKRNATEADKTWKGTYKSEWLTMPKFTARSWTTNRTYYAAEIRKATEERDQLERSMEETEGIIAGEESCLSQSGKGVEDTPRLMQLTGWLAYGDKVIRQLREEEVPLTSGFGESAMERYGKSIDKIGYADVLKLVAEMDPDMKPAFEVAVKDLSRQAVRPVWENKPYL